MPINFLVVAYDIVSNRRRSRLVKVLKDYGLRVNYSVFECEITAQREKELRKRVSAIVDPKDDRVLFYKLCAACQKRRDYIGQRPPKIGPVIIIDGVDE